MSKIGQFIRSFRPSFMGNTEERGMSMSDGKNLKEFLDFFGWGATPAKPVNQKTSLQLAPLWACVFRVSESIASIPKHVIEKDGNTVNRITEDPLQYLINVAPNNKMTAFDFWTLIMIDSLTRGRGYAFINRDKSFMPTELIFIPFNAVTREASATNVRYYISGIDGHVSSDYILEISSFGGLSAISYHRQTIGLGLGVNEYGNDYFAKGGRKRGIFRSDNSFQDIEDLKKMAGYIKERWASDDPVLVLDNGYEFKNIEIPPDDSQFLETKKVNGSEICQIYSVPPVLVQVEMNVKYDNMVEANTQFVQYCLTNHAVKIEQEIKRKIFGQAAYPNRFVKFNMNGLLRGDLKSRTEHYDKMLKNGTYSINDVRMLENLNPIEGGDMHFVQVNQIPLHLAEKYGERLIKGKGVVEQKSQIEQIIPDHEE